MKRHILTLIFSFFFLSIYGQIKTEISGFIPDFFARTGKIELHIIYPSIIGNGHKVICKSTLKSGRFNYLLNLTEPISVSLTLNDIPLLFPGTYSTIINPGDSVQIVVPDSKKLGILNLEFSGKGSEKNNFQKTVVAAKLELYKRDPPYQNQSLEYKFQSTDRKLDAIDFYYKRFSKIVRAKDRDIIRAIEYSSVLDNLFITAMNSKSDSLNELFNKYIVKNKRMLPFYKDDCIYFDGNFIAVRDYIILTEYKNPQKFGGTLFRKLHPVKYCELVIKHMAKNPLVKEYLLSDAALNVFSREQDSENSQKIFQIFCENVKDDSPFYGQILNAYQVVQSRLKKGMSFYNFSLKDVSGKMHNLSDFNGKVIILDLWFNGCGGCAQMAPEIDSLEKNLKGKNIQFLSISIDRDEKLWRNGIGKFSAKNSIQLFTDGLEMKHPLISFLKPRGFPFLAAVDKKGNLIGIPPDPRFSKDAFIRFIEPYL
ncbi:TlpA family protein disulfide reductase [Sphingobacterium siyangense]|uniref:TlpA family protein disulfide reductase n=1 Tax=Sphingobacterium siyangense TaxID=459529 RepID=UPI0019653F97|nr:TlpA disulfide reductase family protein [Sphingobacterium siyangense]QRY55943.1 TlpA family protein disulfide reductase [Sphingobacterium siyangense]